MSPLVERFSPEVAISNTGYFWIQMNTQEPLDPIVFDSYASELGFPADSPNAFSLKWIVRGDRIIFFSTEKKHSGINFGFNYREKSNIIPQAAGLLSMRKSEEGVYTRTLSDYSMTLESVLPKENSNRYKLEELPGKLNVGGTFFEFK